MDPWNIRQSDGTIVWRHMAAILDFKMADTNGIVGHLEIQYGGHVTSNNGAIWLATPENLGIATWIIFVSALEQKLWAKGDGAWTL